MLELTPVSSPEPQRFDQAAYMRRYNKTDKGKGKKRAYRHDNSKWVTDAVYLSRPIVGIDGEGITRSDGSHDYIMLAISGKPSLRHDDNSALSRMELLSYLWLNLNQSDLNVIYGGGYDFNMWLKGSDAATLKAIYKGGFLSRGVIVDGFKIKWTPGKMFQIGRGKKVVTIYDTVAFFQCPFVDALDSVLKEYEGRDFLIRQKASRSIFQESDADEISRYNNLEVELLVKLIGTLREHLNTAQLRPNRWYGPGALATAVMRRERIKDAMAICPPEVARAARFAYAGGRFEMFKYGHSDKPVWEYDINSAYPAAIAKLPNLARGVWQRHEGDPGDRPFAVYRVTVTTGELVAPNPLFFRTRKGSICYPPVVTGWYWSPEIAATRKYLEKYGGEMVIHEAWEFVRDPDAPLPFDFVGSMYAKRQVAKRNKEGVQIAYKLTLNSLYGKLAQQVGWVAAEGVKAAKLPPYHQLEWAGFITSYARSLILQAITLDRDSIIATETDAVFSTRPLDLPVNDGLGAWKESKFNSLTYVQSGLYFADSEEEGPIVKCRGVDKGSITRQMVDDILDDPMAAHTLDAPLTRFMGAGTSLVRGLSHWTRWETETKTMKLYPTGKRVHDWCPECTDGSIGRKWHYTLVPHPGGVSAEYPVAWINPDPLMTELEEARVLEVDYADEMGV